MKILPDYLIQYMPELEQALEELRLSVVDHMYDLLKCLDIDELSSDDIRRKLELYSIKLENMTSDWLPNGRFYRMYSSIKHHRTRYNAIQSVVKSGGQFEGIWSSDFNEKQQFNYKLIQLLRHYQMQSPMDGYFYISGDATRNLDGSISGSTLTALSTDALLMQALPAGYTYIYVPWPRPHYPDDSDYFYNVHMLQFDRLHYAEDCDKPYAGVYHTDYPASLFYYSNVTEKQPPYWIDYHYDGDNTYPNIVKWPVKESGIYYDKDGNEIARIVINKSKYDPETHQIQARSTISIPHNDGDIRTWEIVTDAAEIALLNKEAVKYVPDESCSVIYNSDSNWISNCHLHVKYKTSEPCRLQKFTPIERTLVISDIVNEENVRTFLSEFFKFSIEEIERLLEKDTVQIPLKIEDCTVEYLDNLNNALESYADSFAYLIAENTIDENCLIEPDLTFSPKTSAYKFDRLTSGLLFRVIESLHHIKTYRPVWDVSSPIFAMMQSSYNSTYDAVDTDDNYGWGSSSHSLYYWMHLKQSNNIPNMSDDTLIYNEPPVSEITFTSYDRPTTSILDPIYSAFFYPEPSSGNNVQGDNYQLQDIQTTYTGAADEYTLNLLYPYGEATNVEYDPTLSYTIMNLGRDDDGEIITFDDNITAYLIGNPASVYLNDPADANKKSLIVFKNGQQNTRSVDPSEYNYVTYKTSKIHKLWFNADKTNKVLNPSDGRTESKLYNNVGCTEHYLCSVHTENGVAVDNVAILNYNILGVYDEDGNKVDTDAFTMSCIISGTTNADYCYLLSYSIGIEVTAAYVLFTVSTSPGEMEILRDNRIETNLHLNHLARSRQILHITMIAEYIEPAVILTGGNYITNELNVSYPITGGSYVTNSLDVSYPITGGQYITESLDVLYPITGGNYVTNGLDISYPITGGQYVTNEVNVSYPITGGSYITSNLDISYPITGGNYVTNELDVSYPITGGSYITSNLDVSYPITGGSYITDELDVDYPITGGNYITENLEVSYPIIGGQYITENLEVSMPITGGSYVTENIEVSYPITGGSYVTEELGVDYPPAPTNVVFNTANFNVYYNANEHTNDSNQEIYIGVTTQCESGTTTLYSPYFWAYGFDGGASYGGSNWYNPRYFASANNAFEDINATPGGTIFSEVILSSGWGSTYIPGSINFGTYNSAPEFYMNAGFYGDEDSSAIIISFGPECPGFPYRYQLPSSLYSISGTTITWNMQHPLMALLQGKKCS